MTKQKLAAMAVLPVLFAFSAAAMAQESPVTPPADLPPGVRDIAINPPPGAVVKSQGRFYIWGDAPALKPPATAPSASDTPMPMPGPDQATALNPSTTRTTAVMRGAVGYVLPGGSYSDKRGSNARVEIGAASAKASTSLTPSATLNNPQLLNGWTLGGCTNCNSLSSIDYEGRELSVKAATDYQQERSRSLPRFRCSPTAAIRISCRRAPAPRISTGRAPALRSGSTRQQRNNPPCRQCRGENHLQAAARQAAHQFLAQHLRRREQLRHQGAGNHDAAGGGDARRQILARERFLRGRRRHV